MKFLTVAVAIVCAVAFYSAYTEAAIAVVDFSNPAYPNKCVLGDNHIMSPGQTGKVPNNPCAGVTCMDNGKATFKTCDAVAPGKGCKLRGFVNINASFPECCKRTVDCTPQI